jgi:hypothetical protein
VEQTGRGWLVNVSAARAIPLAGGWFGLAIFTAKENRRTEAVVTTEKRCPTAT